MLQTVPYGAEHEVAQGVHVTLVDAGHILGSSIVRMRLARPGGGRDTIVVFSGDLGRPGTPILRDPTPMTEADVVLCESTYGGREHEAAEQSIATLAAGRQRDGPPEGRAADPVVRDRADPGDRVGAGPARSMPGRIPQLPLYLDSPMAKSASDIYRAHPEAYDEETATLLRDHDAPLDYPGQHVVQNVQESERIAQAAPPYIIVASNGMLTGGRSVGHAERLLDDPSATMLFVGYQGEGTLGGHLVRGAQTARINGPRDADPGDDPVARRLLRPRRRARAARLARRLHRRPPRRRPGRAARRVPRPRRPARPGGAGPEGRRRSACPPRSPPGTRRCPLD